MATVFLVFAWIGVVSSALFVVSAAYTHVHTLRLGARLEPISRLNFTLRHLSHPFISLQQALNLVGLLAFVGAAWASPWFQIGTSGFVGIVIFVVDYIDSICRLHRLKEEIDSRHPEEEPTEKEIADITNALLVIREANKRLIYLIGAACIFGVIGLGRWRADGEFKF
ncbi:hypothetical protein RQP46_005862 [Phenoliferia psychrophenolica]